MIVSHGCCSDVDILESGVGELRPADRIRDRFLVQAGPRIDVVLFEKFFGLIQKFSPSKKKRKCVIFFELVKLQLQKHFSGLDTIAKNIFVFRNPFECTIEKL